jgi:hypothetical protein
MAQLGMPEPVIFSRSTCNPDAMIAQLKNEQFVHENSAWLCRCATEIPATAGIPPEDSGNNRVTR